jgi:hypothetical protein
MDLCKEIDKFKEFDLFLVSNTEIVPPGEPIKKIVD